MGAFDDLVPSKKSSGAFDDLIPKRTVGGTIADLGISALKGAIEVPEAAVGIADLATGGQAGKLTQAAGFRPGEAKSYLDTLYSPAQQAANQEVANAKGFLPTIAAAVQNPSFIVNNAIESSPSMLVGAGVARGAMALAPKLGAVAAGAIGEGATAAGQNAEQVRQEDPNGTLTGKQSAILAASGALTGGIGLAAGRVANKLGIGDVNTMLASGHLGPVGEQAVAAGASKGMLRKATEGAAVEGIGQELPQSYQEQVGQNLAQGKPWDEVAGAAGAQGMLAGGLMGAVGGPLHSHEDEHAADTDKAPVNAAPTTPTGPAIDPAGGPLQKAAAMVAPGPIDYTKTPIPPAEQGGLALAPETQADPNALPFEAPGFAASQKANGLENLQTYSGMGQGHELSALQPIVAQMQAAGKDYSIIPHNDGGYTIAPTSGLTPSILQAVASLQPAPQAAPLSLPAPGTAQPGGDIIADAQGNARQATYGDQLDARRAAAAAQLQTLGESVPFGPNKRLMPFSESAATKQAAVQSDKTGEPFTVVPHPSVDGKFAVVPTSSIIDQAGAPNEQSVSADGVPVRNDSTGGAETTAAPQPTTETGSAPNAQPAVERQAVPAAPVSAAGVDIPAANLATKQEPALAGEKINKAWTAFAPESGTLNVPRAEMPQIKAEHRGAMVNFLKARGIDSTQEEVPANSLRPTQAEFSPARITKAKNFTGGDRSILVSSDNHVLDGHHQWLAKREAGESVKIIRLHAPISPLLDTVKEFPSAQQQSGSTTVPQGQPQQQNAAQNIPENIPRAAAQGQEALAVIKPGLAAIQAARAEKVAKQTAGLTKIQQAKAARDAASGAAETPVAPAGKEVVRYTSRQKDASGKYKTGSGMDAFNAKQFSGVLNRENPALQHVPVERENGRFDVVGQAKPGLAKIQVAKAAREAASQVGEDSAGRKTDSKLLQGGESVPAVASGANPFAVSPPKAGVAVTMTSGQSSENTVADKAKIGKDAAPSGEFEQFLKEPASAGAPTLDHKLIRQVVANAPAKDVLATIVKESTNGQYRVLAQKLIDMGIKSSLELGSVTDQKFAVKNQDRYTFAAAYSPKRDAVVLFRANNVERNLLHEFTHAATYKAVHSNGLAAAQMKALYQHVEESGLMGGHYGMENVDEFVAEAFSNPKFQADLRDVPGSRTGGSFKNAWDRFVNLVRGILRLPQSSVTALDQAMRIGGKLMQENAALKQSESTGKDVGLMGNAADRGTIAGATEMLRSGKTLADATGNIKSLLQSDRRFGIWDRTIGTQFNKATKDADFKRVFDALNRQSEDTAHFAIEAERLAPDVLQRLESVKDIAKALGQGGTRYQNDLSAVSKALFHGIEGNTGIQQQVFTPAQLEHDFQLTPKQIEMYQQVRAAVDTSIDRLAQTFVMSMGEAAGMDVKHLQNATLEQTAKAVKDGTNDGVVGKNIPGMEPVKAAELHQRIDDLVEHANHLQEKGYMPAMRFGQYAVTVTDPKGGNPLHFEMFENQLKANIAAHQLAKEFPGMDVRKSVMNPEAYRMFKGVSPETVELFAKFSGMDDSQAFKDYIALARSGRSTMKRMLERKGIAGFSQDVSRVLAQFISSNSRQSALNVNGAEISNAMASPALATKGDVQQEAQQLVDYMQNPREEAQKLRGLLFMNFLGGSVASAATNLTQPVLQTAPYLAQFAGAKTVGIMASSARMAATGKIADPGLRAALQRAADDGITEPHEIHNLMADASGSTLGTSIRARALTKAWGSFFSLSESYNRRLTFLAAYQTAMAMGPEQLKAKGFKDAFDFAGRAIIETQGLYSKTNRPNWARGAVGATLFTFKQFSISYIEFLNRLPPKQKALALAILVMAAGLQGLPFADDIEDVIDTLGQSLGYNTNSKKALRETARDILGDTAGALLTHGISSQTGVDMQGRLGMGNLIPGTSLFKQSETDKGRDVAEFAGPIGSVLQSFQQAFAKAQNGYILGNNGALATLAPTSIKNALQAAEMAQTGKYEDSKNRKVVDVDLGDAAIKALGFQPNKVALQSRVAQDLQQDAGMIQSVKSGIADRWARGVADQDSAQVKSAVESLHQWNENNPDSKIQITMSQIQGRVKQMMMDRATRFIKATPKVLRAEAAREIPR